MRRHHRVHRQCEATVAGVLAAMATTAWAPRARALPTYVACIGDSITAGYAASSPSLDWVSDLSGLLGPSVTVQNDGVSTTTMMKQSNFSYWTNGDLPEVESFVGDAGVNASVAVIIMLGTNDSKDVPSAVDNWDAGAPQRFDADYNAMIDLLQGLSPKPQVFLALPPPAFQNSADIDDAVLKLQIDPIIEGIAAARQLPLIDVRAALDGMSSLFVDGIHPNDQGHALIAQAMYAGLLNPAIPGADGGFVEGGAGDDGGASLGAGTSDGGAGDGLPDAFAIDGPSGGALDGSALGPEDAGAGSGGQGGGCGCSGTGLDAAIGPTFLAALAALGAGFVARRRWRSR